MSFSLVARRSPLSGAARRLAVRFESTQSNNTAAQVNKAAEAAKQTAAKATAAASEFSAKAAQGLSRVSSAVGPAIAGAAKGAAEALGKVGGRTGRVIGFIERQTPTVVYYSKVGLELAKLVAKGQNMTPPSLQTLQTYYQYLIKQLQHPSRLLHSIVQAANPQQLRNITRAQAAAGGVLFAECLGFFTVGEMIGRFKLIGYRGKVDHGDHH